MIIQNDTANPYSPITIVAAMTSKFDLAPYPTEVVLEATGIGLTQRSAVLLNQIRSVDRQRLMKRIGRVDASVIRLVDRAIQITLAVG